jgi:hypothetical protein
VRVYENSVACDESTRETGFVATESSSGEFANLLKCRLVVVVATTRTSAAVQCVDCIAGTCVA